jgi:hypothetical protein
MIGICQWPEGHCSLRLSLPQIVALRCPRRYPSMLRKRLTPGCLIYNRQVSRNELNEAFSHEFRPGAHAVGSRGRGACDRGPDCRLWQYLSACCYTRHPQRTHLLNRDRMPIVVSAPSTQRRALPRSSTTPATRCWRLRPSVSVRLPSPSTKVGGNGYTLNSDGTLSNFPAVQFSAGQAGDLHHAAFYRGARQPVLPSAGLYAADLTGNVVDVFTGFPQTFKLAIPVAPTPVMIVGQAL